MNTEDLIKSYYDDLNEHKDKIKKFNELKILSANEIVKKIQNGDKDFSDVRIVGVDWSRRDLSGFNFSGSKLEWNVFNRCKLAGADFSNVFVDFCAFSSADLTKANFENSLIWDSSFDGAILKDANFVKSVITYVVFADANVNAANFTNATKIAVYESWEDVGEENFDATIAIIEKLNFFPRSLLLAWKARLEKYRTKVEKFRVFYGIGRAFMNPKGNLYKYPAINNDLLIGRGVYVGEKKDNTYTKKTEYGKKRPKDDEIFGYTK